MAVVDFPWMLLGARFGLDTIGLVFLGFSAFLYLIAGIVALSYSVDKRFFLFYAFSMAGNLGLILAQDAISFYFFFALMTFSAYGLVVYSENAEAFYAGKIYLILAIFGELLLFSGIALAASQAGSLFFGDLKATGAAAALLFFGFGIKAGILPLHVWLPLAHPVAPTPASAVLSACMIKAGLLGWLRFLPLGAMEAHEWGAFVELLGYLAALFGVIVGLAQSNAKVVLAYSSISQMGLMTAAVGFGMQFPEKWEGCLAALLLYATVHALVKAALFLSVGLRFGLLALIPILAMIGAPFTAGAFAKELLKTAIDGGLLLKLSSLGTALLMTRFALLLWRQESKRGVEWAWAVLVLAILFLPLPLLRTFSLRPFEIGQYLPAACGAVIGAFFIVRSWNLPVSIPVGDLLVLYVKGYRILASLASAASGNIAALYRGFTEIKVWSFEMGFLNRTEKSLRGLPLYCALFIVGTLLVALLQF